MRCVTLSYILGIIGLLMISQSVAFLPAIHSTRGTISLIGTQIATPATSCEFGRIVNVHFSATSAPIEFFVVHSDYYDDLMADSLPNVSFCQYYIISQSANYQFTSNRSGLWYLVFTNSLEFANSLQEQDVRYVWTDYSPEEWYANKILPIYLIIISGVILVALVLLRFARLRWTKKPL